MSAGRSRSRWGRGQSGVVGRSARLAGYAAAFAALAALAAPLTGQQQSAAGDADTGATAADSAAAADSTVQFTREVFAYPDQGRRNPFAPVDAGVEEGPQFRNLRLRGVIYSPSVGSVAVLQDETTGERYRVRDGQRIGDARVLQIRRTEVTFNVSGVGQTRRETLQVEKQERESEG